MARRLTLRDELERLAPGWSWSDLFRWPPDVFALTSAALADSGAYRFVVCPPPGRRWPPAADLDAHAEPWQERIRRAAAAWARTAGHTTPQDPPPEVALFCAALADAEDVEVASLEDATRWDVIVTLLTLHALADEVCEGASGDDAWLQRVGARRLAETGSLARLTSDRVRVLPKLRPPESGITLRSLSHHLAFDRSEVATRWYFAPRERARAGGVGARLSLLLVPYPFQVRTSDFRPVAGPLVNMDESRYGFYTYEPREPFDLHEAMRLVEAAQLQVESVDAVVLPEAALDEAEIEPLQESLAAAGVPYLITGARQRPGPEAPFGGNFAHLGGGDWCAPRQHKHHRWLLDPGQVHQYHLGAALDPLRAWWEAISIQPRSITFVSVADWLTVCPLVCEDLARPDPVSDVIRAVAPTLVVGLLLDGPQLNSRWPARYASVLADDPGCSVLTLTSFGMTQRWKIPGCDRSRVVALWKDPNRGLHEIELAQGARAVALTAHVRGSQLISADGRAGKKIPELVLSGLEQIY